MTIPKEVQEYAWNWFEYHAGQRLTAFRYYLMFVGILAVAFNNGLESANYLFASTVAGLGAFVSMAFLALEVRNEALVNVGRDALMEIEKSPGYPDSKKLQLLTVDRGREGISSHKTWLRLIYLAIAILFAIAAFDPSAINMA